MWAKMVTSLWMWFVLVFKVQEIKGQENLYVSGKDGSSEASCGSIRNPCKHLEQAVEMSNRGGRVIVRGVQMLTSSITISKNICIVGLEGATISTNVTSLVAFKVRFPENENRGNFTISNINFAEISMVSIESKSSVRITNCSVHHAFAPLGELIHETMTYDLPKSTDNIKEAVIKMQTGAGGTFVEVRKTIFSGWQQGHILRIGKVDSTLQTTIIFDRCKLMYHLGIALIRVSNVLLKLNSCVFKGMTCTAVKLNQDRRQKSHLFISNSSFSNNKGCSESGFFLSTGGAVSAFQVSYIVVSDSHFEYCTTGQTRGYKVGNMASGGALHLIQSGVLIKRSAFKRNIANGLGGHIHLVSGTFVLEDCAFAHGKAMQGDGGSIMILNANTEGPRCISNSMFIRNFAEGTGGAVSMMMISTTKQPLIMLSKCKFFKNKATVGGGAIGGTFLQEVLVNMKSCIFQKNTGKTGGGLMVIVNERISKIPHLMIHTSLFLDNAAIIGGGVYTRKEKFRLNLPRKQKSSYDAKNAKTYSISIHDCDFRNNSATSAGQCVYSNSPIDLTNISVIAVEKYIATHVNIDAGRINVRSILMKIKRESGYRLSSKSKGIELKSSDIKLSGGLMLICPANFKVDDIKKISKEISVKDEYRFFINGQIIETKYSYLSVDCQACPYGTYSIQRGRLLLPRLSTTVPAQNNFTVNEVKCESCPTGAICDVNTKAVDNFWGFEESSRLSFILCPDNYCCGSETIPCSSFDTCAPGRIGTLCGSCANGYKQNFIAGNCIRRTDTCDVNLFVLYFIVYTFVYTLAFVLITNAKDIVALLRKLLFDKERVISSTSSETCDELSLAGFVQITILFFQVSGLLQVKFYSGNERDPSSSTNGLRKSVTEVFHFRYSIYQQLCPSEHLTLPQKELLLFSMQAATFVHLFLLLTVYRLFKSVQYCSKRWNNLAVTTKPSEGPVLEMELMSESVSEIGSSKVTENERETLETMSFVNMVKLTFIKLLKLYYTPVTKSALTMVHCITIRGTKHLYVYGDQVCYTGWQFGIMAIILPGMVLFPFCFETTLRLLKERKISSWQFVFATVLPYYAIFLYVWKRNQISKVVAARSDVSRVNDEESFRQKILEGEEFLFKESKGCTLGWQLVQYYRTLAITFLSTFIINPMYRQIAFMFLLLLFVIHDRDREPYKHRYLNLLQSLTSRCLIVVLACNFIPAVSYLVNIKTIPLILEVVRVLGVVELLVYAVVPFSLLIWKLKTFIENKRREETKKK